MPRDSLRSWFDVERRPLRGGLANGLAHSLFWVLAFPPLGIFPLVVIGPTLLSRAAMRSSRASRTALGVSIASIPMWAWHHQFVSVITPVGFPFLVLYLSIWPGLFVWLLAHVRSRFPGVPCSLALPIVWTALEVLRGEVVWDGYPWFQLAHPLVPMSIISGFGSIVGSYGVGAMVMAMIGWMFDVAAWKPRGSAASMRRGNRLRTQGVLGAAVIILGAAMIWPDVRKDGDFVVGAIVQTNLPQSNKLGWEFEERLESFEEFWDLTVEAADAPMGPPDVIVWPETMFPGYWLNPEAAEEERSAFLSINGVPTTYLYDEMILRQDGIGIPMIVGGVASDGLRLTSSQPGGISIEQDAIYNSAFLLDNGAVSDTRYDKVFLTPFGEVMPYISAWPWLERQLLALGAGGMSFELDAGRDHTLLQLPLEERGERQAGEIAVATPICFEATMSAVCRRLVYDDKGQRRARLLVNLTNDGWFMWHDGGRETHLLQARWRCIELGTPMIRAANTGLSAFIDGSGRVRKLGPNISADTGRDARVAGVVFDEQLWLPRADSGTVFGRYGNVVGWLCVAAMLSMLIGGSLRSRVHKAAPGGPEPKANDDEKPKLRLAGLPEDEGPGDDEPKPSETAGDKKD